MDKQTRQALCELAVTVRQLKTCEKRMLRIPARFKNLYLHISPRFASSLQVARYSLQELAAQLVEFQNLPLENANLARYYSPKNGKTKS